MKQIIFISVLLLFIISCSTPKVLTSNKPYAVEHCYKATLGNKTYIIGLFEDNIFVFGRDMGQNISLGTYTEVNKEVILSSYIQSSDEVPFWVKESYKEDQEGTLLKLSMLTSLSFLGDWIGHTPTEIELDGLNCANTLPTVPANFDSIYTVQCTEKVEDIISFSSRRQEGLEYKLKDSKSNYFECYYLGFSPKQFSILSDVRGKQEKNQIKILAYLLDREIEDKSLMLNFEEVKKIQTRAGLNATPEGAILSAYYYFTKADRLALIKAK